LVWVMGLGGGRTPKKRKEEVLRNAVIFIMPKRGERCPLPSAYYPYTPSAEWSVNPLPEKVTPQYYSWPESQVDKKAANQMVKLLRPRKKPYSGQKRDKCQVHLLSELLSIRFAFYSKHL